jgi:hypothetical protein
MGTLPRHGSALPIFETAAAFAPRVLLCIYSASSRIGNASWMETRSTGFRLAEYQKLVGSYFDAVNASLLSKAIASGAEQSSSSTTSSKIHSLDVHGDVFVLCILLSSTGYCPK